MKYCSNCGSEMQTDADVCLSCGKSHVTANNTYRSSDTGGIGWGLLGFCVPIAGLILYLVWKEDKPLNAKAAGTGALIYVGLAVLIYVIVFLFVIASY